MSCCTNADTHVASGKPTVLIVGAGFGGLACAKQLVKNGAAKKFRVVLLDSKDYFSIGGMWQFVWNERLESLDKVKWPLSKAVLPGIELKTKTTVEKWSPSDKKVVLSDKSELTYSHIVVACGVVPDPTDIPGIEKTVNICSEPHVRRQKDDLEKLVEKAQSNRTIQRTFCLSISVNPYKCPPAPYELTFLAEEVLRKEGVRDNTKVIVTAPCDWTMPPNTKPVITKAMQEQGIEFLPNKEILKITETDEDSKTIHFKDDTSIDCDVLWTVWPIRAPDFVRDSGIPLNPKGTVNVDNKVTNTIKGYENTHIIGDACRVPFGQKGVPKAGEFAWKMGLSVGDAIAGLTKPADRSGNCAAEAGFGKGFILQPNFSDVCNDPENGKPKVSIELTDVGTDLKVKWCNGYLKEIFGDNVKPVVLN